MRQEEIIMASNGHTSADKEQVAVSQGQWNMFVKASTWATVAVIAILGFLALVLL